MLMMKKTYNVKSVCIFIFFYLINIFIRYTFLLFDTLVSINETRCLICKKKSKYHKCLVDRKKRALLCFYPQKY